MRILAPLLLALLFSNSSNATEDLHCPPQITIGCTNAYCRDLVRQAIRSLIPETTRIVRLDGVISPGGKDLIIDSYLDRVPENEKQTYVRLDSQLGKHTPDSVARDHFELAFWKSYFSEDRYRNTAALGICYGHQVMAVSNGYALYSDLLSQLGIPARYGVEDSVTFSAPFFGSTPSPYLGREEHHQAVRKMGSAQERGEVFATSHQGRIVEGIRYFDRAAYSVQFHPEISRPEVKYTALMPFVRAVCNR